MSSTQANIDNNPSSNNDGADQSTAQAKDRSRSKSTARKERPSSARFPIAPADVSGYTSRARHVSGDSQSSGGNDIGDSNTDLYDAPGASSTKPTPRQSLDLSQVQGRKQDRGRRQGKAREESQAPAPKRDPSEPAPPIDISGYNLNADQKDLLAELIEINGQDSYDALTAGVGKLKKDEYLRLPRNYVQARIRAKDVGKPIAHANIPLQQWAQVYALNKAIAPDGSDAIIFGFLRMEAIKAGWYSDQREVVFVDPVTDAVRTMITDFATIRDKLERIKTAAFVVPLVAEHVFRTMGHHYITSDSATYTARYADTFRSCLLPDISNLLLPAVLYHGSLHWVSPKRSREVLIAQMGSQTIPDALQIRANAAPAGTAILTTTAAIIDSMSSVGLADEFADYGGFDLKLIQKLTETIKGDPTRYHKSYFAYGVNALDAGESTRLEHGKAEAIKFAPYAQAFINTLLRDAALGRAKALQKHAEANPIQMRRASNFFRALIRKEVTDVKKLFEATVSARDVE